MDPNIMIQKTYTNVQAIDQKNEFNGNNFNSLEGIIDSNIKYLYSDFNDNGFFEEDGKLIANK